MFIKMIQLLDENQIMKLIYLSLIAYLVCLKMLQSSIVEGKRNISIVNAYINKTSSKLLKINQFEVTPNGVMFIEFDALQEIKSIYVRLTKLIIS